MRYLIRKGKHRPVFKLLDAIGRPYIGKRYTQEGYFRFHENCFYTVSGEPRGDYLDINKLLGLSFGRHQNHSFRLGWRPKYESKEKEIDIFSFIHMGYDGKYDNFQKLTTVKTTEYIFYSLEYDYYSNKVTVKFPDHTEDEYDIAFSYPLMRVWWGYRLGPYFGGNMRAPNDMDIDARL